MIPLIDILTQEITEITYPSRTYRIVLNAKNELANQGIASLMVSAELNEADRIGGCVDGLEAVIQAIYLILGTERYRFILYSWDYGVEIIDLIGKPMPYVISELPRRIKEALTQDDRINDVIDFEFEKSGRKLFTTFTVVSNVGNISTEMEVAV